MEASPVNQSGLLGLPLPVLFPQALDLAPSSGLDSRAGTPTALPSQEESAAHIPASAPCSLSEMPPLHPPHRCSSFGAQLQPLSPRTLVLCTDCTVVPRKLEDLTTALCPLPAPGPEPQ